MQASVHTFDEQTRTGSVLLDDGCEHAFSADVFGASGLRHVRVGQRVSIEVADPEVQPSPGQPVEGRSTHVSSRKPETTEEGSAGQPSPSRPAVSRMWVVGVGDGQPIR